jgi:hypothetical protein
LIQPLINPLSSPYQALMKPLSSPYSDLIEIFVNCYLVGCFKTPKKEKQNPIQT